MEGQQGWAPQNKLPPKAPIPPPEMSRFPCSWHLLESLMKQAASTAPFSAALYSQWAAIHTTSPSCQARLTLARVLPTLPSSLPWLPPLKA